MGLTALLTPYLLVIVSTTPVAETQHKSSRPKELAPHSALSGCLAWFPAVKLKASADSSQQGVSRTKLVYCWSNVMTVLDIDVHPAAEKDKPPNLNFQARNRWTSEEAITAVQWLSRSVIGVLTISQRLLILEDGSMRVTDSFDLIHKHIFHQDLFSRQLHRAVEQLDESDTSMHGVVADGFHMSFRAYKGRLFVLGFNDISVGALSNWADRLVALMEEGDYIAALELATSYYNGDADKITVGLPEDDGARHGLVREKLLEMIAASLRYTFARIVDIDSERGQHNSKELAVVTFTACLSMKDLPYLFEDVYEAFHEHSADGIFFETLEPYILDAEVSMVSPDVLQDLISYYASAGRGARLEEMICRLDTQAMDLDQVTMLCKQYFLYDALTYVWNRAIGDFITPLVEYLSLIKMMDPSGDDGERIRAHLEPLATKVFAYLAFSFTGRIYPSGDNMPEPLAAKAKGDLYGFVLSGRTIEWPPGSKTIFLSRTDGSEEPSYPYLRLLLHYDTPSSMSMLNEAFENSYLNQAPDIQTNGASKRQSSNGGMSKLVPTRQIIVSILLDVMSSDDFYPEDTVYVDMFIARNLPKFHQYINLPGNTLHKVIEGLCDYRLEEISGDCQLSVEYLLSFYHPSDLESLIPLFQNAHFYRVLKSVYRRSKQYANLLQTCFEDPEDAFAVFDCIRECLRSNDGLTDRQAREVQAVVMQHPRDLVAIDPVQAARTLSAYAPQLIEQILDAQDENSHVQYLVLKTLLEPEQPLELVASKDLPLADFEERYVQLMCFFDPTHVADYVGRLPSSNLRLDRVLPALESSGVIDAAVTLMARDGQIRQAMERLVKHLRQLESALLSLIQNASKSPEASQDAAEGLLESISRYGKVGLWLCQRQSRAEDAKDHTRRARNVEDSEQSLTLAEFLWLELVDTLVSISMQASSAAAVVAASHSTTDNEAAQDGPTFDPSTVIQALRTTVQQTFSAMLATTNDLASPLSSSQPRQPTSGGRRTPSQPDRSFLLILRAFLTRASASSPSVSDLRSVLAEIFSAYTFEEKILHIANTFLDKDLFANSREAHGLRQRGWRPRGQVCEGCRRRVWGPGAGLGVWDEWVGREEREAERRERERVEREGGERRMERGKGRAMGEVSDGGGDTAVAAAVPAGDVVAVPAQGGHHVERKLGAVVVFACRHMWHKGCLERAHAESDKSETSPTELRCPLC